MYKWYMTLRTDVCLDAASCCNHVVNNYDFLAYDVCIDNDIGIRIYLIPIFYVVGVVCLAKTEVSGENRDLD